MPYAVSVPPVDFNEKLLTSVPCGNVITKEPSLLLHTLHNELPLTPHLPYIFLLLSSNSTFAPSTAGSLTFPVIVITGAAELPPELPPLLLQPAAITASDTTNAENFFIVNS